MSGVEAVRGFGLYNFSVSPVHRPSTVPELVEVLADCRRRGESFVFRGAGRSYGDAAINPCGAVVELTGLKAVRGLDDASGVLTAECGVTIEDVWHLSIPRGFWPPVVPGTMFTTLGGCLAMNIHGKNNWKMGTLGEHVRRVAVLEADGIVTPITREDPEFLHVISGWRTEEPIVEADLELKRVETGYLDVEALATPGLASTLAAIDGARESHEYAVSWTDCFASGRGLGRSVVHLANVHPKAPGEPDGLSVEAQLADVQSARKLPVGLLLFGLKTMSFDGGIRLINAAKYAAARLGGRKRYRQSLVAFSFLLDYIPGWNGIYLPGGFIQYQMFIPKERAESVFTEVLRRQQAASVVSYLGVMKRHRPDRFANSHAVDGFSFAMDFPVTRRNSPRLIALCRSFDALVKESGGRLYKAKDCVGSWERVMGSRVP